MVESNDAVVQRTGNWVEYETALASGGRYLYSSGSHEDTLVLTFTGSRVDVIFIMHPALGSFALVLDDTPLQTVSCTAQDAQFGARVSLSMGAGRHTLRIVPVNGVIAIDAFAVEGQVELTAPPTIEPTVEPTIEPTMEPTIEPTVIPTELPTETPPPTVTPVPTELPTETPVPTVVPTETPIPTVAPPEVLIPTVEPTPDSTAVPENE